MAIVAPRLLRLVFDTVMPEYCEFSLDVISYCLLGNIRRQCNVLFNLQGCFCVRQVHVSSIIYDTLVKLHEYWLRLLYTDIMK